MADMGRSNSSSPTSSSSPTARGLPPNIWRTPLLVGLCFGLGYGITNRLLDLSWNGLVRLGHSFNVRPLPGTSLESLRQRYGAEGLPIRADLDRGEREAQARKAEQLERQQAELERQRLQQAEPAMDPSNEPAAEATPELPSDWHSPTPSSPPPSAAAPPTAPATGVAPAPPLSPPPPRP